MYKHVIEQRGSSSVWAEVWYVETNRRINWDMFQRWPFESQEHVYERARRWAKHQAETAATYEVPTEPRKKL